MSFPACLVLCGLLAVGCAAKTPKPPADRAPIAHPQSAQPRPKRPLVVSVLSWFGSIPNLLPRKAKPPQAQVPRLIGIVKAVNIEDRFVLIDAATFQGAQAGDLLVCIRDQKETANLRMSTLKNPPFLIADIASGNPSPGDRAFKP
ncbi:MAG TPA: hypothetical protein VIS96_14095 [Terrimicrobiaceae bacterium]